MNAKRLNNGFKYWSILIYIGNIILGFEIPGMEINPIISVDVRTHIADIAHIDYQTSEK